MKITSPAFSNKGQIPEKYTCKGEGISMPLEFSQVPPEVKSLVLIMEDLDAPGRIFVHWTVWNIDPTVQKVEENSVPQEGVEGKTSIGSLGYVPPCPPSGTHRYVFHLYALDEKLDLPEGVEREELDEAMGEHIVAEDDLTGLFGK